LGEAAWHMMLMHNQRTTFAAAAFAIALASQIANPAALAVQTEPELEAEASTAPSAELQRRSQDVLALMINEAAAEDIFAAQFLAAVPPAQFAQITKQLTDQFGPAIAVEYLEQTSPTTASIGIRFERAIGRGIIAIEPQAPNKITGLVLRQFDPLNDSAAKIEADLSALPGKVNAFFGPIDGSTAIVSLGDDEALAIGSTFKLFVLSALARQIENGERQWSDIVPLTRRSFPSGRMQDWPDSSPVTLHTLATMMISISDNTATDQLIAILGRETIEQELFKIGIDNPQRNLPLLSTVELFALKSSPENMRKYIEADESRKRFILQDFLDDTDGDARNLPTPNFTEPRAIDTLEWFANPQDIRRLMARLASSSDDQTRAILAVNPALPESVRADWAYVGFKGGSEPGVLNLSWLLTDKAGQDHVLTMSWNNPQAAVDDTQFELIAQRILALKR
jgi:beta-lactamase class A